MRVWCGVVVENLNKLGGRHGCDLAFLFRVVSMRWFVDVVQRWSNRTIGRSNRALLLDERRKLDWGDETRSTTHGTEALMI